MYRVHGKHKSIVKLWYVYLNFDAYHAAFDKEFHRYSQGKL